MFDNSDVLIFDDSDSLSFAEECNTASDIAREKWKVMIVDDEQEIHSVTKMVLGKFVFEGKSIEFISSYSMQEAIEAINQNPDTALLLLDVVMEDDHSGLQLVKYIREELKNNLVRIILRTGQAGQAPEERVVIDYDINDYKEKTELTSQKLFSTVVSSLRSYRDLTKIDTNRKGLRKIINSFSNIFEMDSLNDFANSVLTQFISILDLNNQNICSSIPSSFAAVKKDSTFYIMAATGNYSENINKRLQDSVSPAILLDLEMAYRDRRNIYHNDRMVVYLKSKTGSESLVYFEECSNLDKLDKDLIEVFCSNVSAVNESIVSSSRYESERQQRLLSENLRELNERLTSSLDIMEVMGRLIEFLYHTFPSDTALAFIKKSRCLEIFIGKGDTIIMDNTMLPENSLEHYIFTQLDERRAPILVADTEKITNLHEMPYFDSDIRSVLGLPVIHKGSMLAAVILLSHKPGAYGNNDRNMALTFANQAGVAIENAFLYSELKNRNASIKNLLDNAGQGFLTFGDDMLVDEEYSLECLNIFGEPIENRKFPNLIYTDLEQRTLLEFMLVKVLSEESENKINLYIPLLPDEVLLNGKNVKIEYKIISSSGEGSGKRFMVILTDITDVRSLENKMEEERRTLKMVVKAITNYNNFTKYIKDFRRFCDHGVNEILNSPGKPDEIVYEIYRNIHTFKGNFSQMEMLNIVEQLHSIESSISEMRRQYNGINLDAFRQYIESLNMPGLLDNDMYLLKEILGDSFFSQEKAIFIDQVKLVEIESKMASCSTSPCHLLTDLRRLRYRPFKDLLRSYPEYVLKLSDTLDKPVHPLSISGDDIMVDTERFYDFSRSLVHIFRNAMSHGIESVGRRVECGKDEYGRLNCHISFADRCTLSICVTDDGQGLDMETIKRKAAENGVDTSVLSETELVALIFNDEFSTRKNITDVSGRGMGLSAVKHEVEKLGGCIRVETEPDKGTRFIFELPCSDAFMQ